MQIKILNASLYYWRGLLIIRHKSIDHYYSQLWIIISCCLVAKLYLTLCDPLDLLDSSVHGVLQAGILEWVAISFFRGCFQISDGTCISCIGRWILYHWAPREAQGLRLLIGQMYLRYFTLQGLLCCFVNWTSVFSIFYWFMKFQTKGEKSVTLCLWDWILPW